MIVPVERAARTQAMFREVNEQIAALTRDSAVGVTLFVCECSREGCAEALELTLAQYEEVRCRDDRFLVADGHQLEEIERVVDRLDGFLIVEKYGRAAAVAAELTTR
jgi:hypothetical protein